LFYGKDVFGYLEIFHIWDEIVEHLKSWKTSAHDLPEVSFDLIPENALN
jgi:hypothetical protein